MSFPPVTLSTIESAVCEASLRDAFFFADLLIGLWLDLVFVRFFTSDTIVFTETHCQP